jgi:hypothetical protein
MPQTVTLTELITRVRRVADVENDTSRFPDAEVTQHVNDANRRLYERVIDWDPKYFATTAALVTVAGVATVALPATCYRVLGVAAAFDSATTRWLELLPLQAIYDSDEAHPWTDASIVGYVLVAQTIRFVPTPSAVYPITLWHVPICPALAGAGTIDAVNGWDQAVVLRAAMACARKEADGEMVALIERELSDVESHLRSTITPRDLGAPARVVARRWRIPSRPRSR